MPKLTTEQLQIIVPAVAFGAVVAFLALKYTRKPCECGE